MTGKRKESQVTDTHEVVDKADALAAKSVLHPAVAEVLKKNPTPEALAQIFELQRQWEKDEARRAFNRAKVDLRAALPPWIERDSVVDYTGAKGRVRYTHLSLAGALDAVTPALTEYGFNLSWKTDTPNGKVRVTATITHRDGHSECSSLEAPPDMSGNKSASQGAASTVTLLERYTALALLGIATGDMKDPEPTDDGGKEKGNTVDTQKNMKAVTWIIKQGKTKKEAEEFVQQSVEKWTAADLDKLRDWIKPTN